MSLEIKSVEIKVNELPYMNFENRNPQNIEPALKNLDSFSWNRYLCTEFTCWLDEKQTQWVCSNFDSLIYNLKQQNPCLTHDLFRWWICIAKAWTSYLNFLRVKY